ncbi:hypothetical protein BDV96DRAFT_692846 [Lophiotrema nucula]|uniref:Nephrocystin 3-like N-terminal domain-containing protein n=1 Tax=Lophiotrema nucula TaxID=690887 RepID=A0A6A5YPP5_9PLEO|nr:hypothetical protein BDV96DRAFT_692846 [Lophiotrema nucula]
MFGVEALDAAATIITVDSLRSHELKDVKREEILDTLSERERERVYTFVETTNPSDIHNHSQRLYEPGTASWMLRTPEWPLWMEGKHRCLWITGIPGAGKSILASYLVEKIQKHCTSSSSKSLKLGHAYYYCYFGHNQNEASHFLGWMIGQLCRQSGRVPEELQKAYKSRRSPTLSSLLAILHSTLGAFERVYVVLDAVDESLSRADLLSVIGNLSTDPRFSCLGLIVTSRVYIDIERVMKTCSVQITMSNPFVKEDIGTFVQSTLNSDARYQRWPEDLRLEVQHETTKRAKRI